MLTVAWPNLLFYTLFICLAWGALHPKASAPEEDEPADLTVSGRRSDIGWAVTFAAMAFAMLLLPH